MSTFLRGAIAYNPKDLEPLGYIDSIVTGTDPQGQPKGTPIFWWPDGEFTSNWGQVFPAAKFKYTSVDDDLTGIVHGDAKTYVVFFTFIYYDSEGVEVKRATRTVKLVILHSPLDPDEELKTDGLNTKYLYPFSEDRKSVEFEVQGTLHLEPGSPFIDKIVGLQYDDIPAYGRNTIRVLPSDRLGIQLYWSNNISMPSPQSVDVNITGLGLDFGPVMDVAWVRVPVSWCFQIVNASTLIDREIVITQKMLDAPRWGNSIAVQIVGDDEGVMKVLCACDAPLDLNESEKEKIGEVIPENKIEEAGNRLSEGFYGDGLVQDERLKRIYRSDYTNRATRVPNQSTMHASREDLTANKILINPLFDTTGGNTAEIEAGHKIYVTYNHVYRHFVRHHVRTDQSFTAMFTLGFPSSFDLTWSSTDAYSFLPSSFWVSKDQTDFYSIYNGGVEGDDEDDNDDGEFGLIQIVPGVNPYLQEKTNSTWAKYIADQEAIKIAAEEGIPESEVETSLVEWFGQRQINSMLPSHSTWSNTKEYEIFPNGIIVGADTYDGGKSGGILWIDLSPITPRVIVLIPKIQINDQEWFEEWFAGNKRLGKWGVGNDVEISNDRFIEWDRSHWDLFFDQNIFVNSFVADNDKLVYESFTAEAFMNLSKFDPNDDTGSTGLGFANLDFYKPGTLEPRIDGLPEIDSEYYSDASSSFFITPPRQSSDPAIWKPNVISSIAGVQGSPASVTQIADHHWMQPLSLGLNGRLYFEQHPPVLINQPFIVRVNTRLTSSNVSGANANYNRTKGFYCAPDPDGVHTRMYVTDSDVLDTISSLEIVSSDFSHDDNEELVSYPYLYSYRGLSGTVPVYSQGMRILPFAPSEAKTMSSHRLDLDGDFYSIELPGYVEKAIFSFGVDVESLSDKYYITISISGESASTEFIDLLTLPSSGRLDVYMGYINGTMSISMTPTEDIKLIKGITAELYYIGEDEMELISKDCMSCSPLIDGNGNYCVYELLSDGTKSNMLVLKSGNVDGPYSAFPYLFLTIGIESISNLLVRSDFKSYYSYLFFVIDGSLLMRKINPLDLDVSQIARADSGFLKDGLSETAFSYIKYHETEYPVLSYNYLFENILNKCRQLTSVYMEPAFFIQGDVVDNDWIKNEILASVSFDEYMNQSKDNPNEDFDFSKLSDDDTYSPRVIVSGDISNASIRASDDYLANLGYNKNIESFTAEIISNGNIIVFYTIDGKVYGRISSNYKNWIPLFGLDAEAKVRGYNPVRVSSLNPIEVGLSEDTDMFYIEEEDISDDLLDADLSSETAGVNSISSCYDSESDSLYLFYVCDGFIAYHKISGRSLIDFSGEDIFYRMDTSTPRALMRGREELGDLPFYLVGILPDGFADAITIEGDNYLQFKYSIESIESLQSEEMAIRESSISAFVLSRGIVRFMYTDSGGSLRGGIIFGSTIQLDVQLRE